MIRWVTILLASLIASISSADEKEDVLEFFVPENPEHVSHSLLNLQKTEDSISVKVKRLSSLMKELGVY